MQNTNNNRTSFLIRDILGEESSEKYGKRTSSCLLYFLFDLCDEKIKKK